MDKTHKKQAESKPNNLKYWLSLLHAPALSPLRLQKLLDCFKTPQAICALPPPVLEKFSLSDACIQKIQNPDQARLNEALIWAQQPNQHIIPLHHPSYPALLKQIPNPPFLLFVQGQLKTLSAAQLAMVGSRNPSPLAIETAQQFAQNLAESGLIITSGLAIGIDTASHQGALAANAPTIAVLGSGLLNIYPKRNQTLAHQNTQNGALISEFPLHSPPIPAHFPQRNRIISGLSIGTLVVEATCRSGSLITARMALEQGREVFAIPGSIHNPKARGCHMLLKQGAKLVESLADINEELQALHIHANLKHKDIKPIKTAIKLDSDHHKLLECIGYEVATIDQIIQRYPLRIEQIAAMLLTLELEDYIRPVAGGYIRCL